MQKIFIILTKNRMTTVQNFTINNLPLIRPKRDSFNQFYLQIESTQVYPNNDLVTSFAQMIQTYISPLSNFSEKYSWENILHEVAQQLLQKYKNINRVLIRVNYLQIPSQNISINYDVSISVDEQRPNVSYHSMLKKYS